MPPIVWHPMRRRRPRVTFVGDIGGVRTLHVGDEAMFAADLELVRRLVPRARYVAVSADPGTTSSWYRVAAVPRLSTVELRALGAARDADLLFITGGGNLNAAFPMMIHEYLAQAAQSSSAGRPSGLRWPPVMPNGSVNCSTSRRSSVCATRHHATSR